VSPAGVALQTGRASVRIARAGARIAGVGATALATARQLRQLRATPGDARVRARANALRDAARDVLALHGLDCAASGAPVPVQAILVSNHVSWLDPLVVAAHVPCVPVSKADVSGWPLVGGLARDFGVVFVSRGNAGSGASALRSIRAALDAGACVLNFPEGTTSGGDGVLPFRPGLFGLGLRAGAPIVPVAIRYEPRSLAWIGDASFLPHYLALASSRGGRVSVRFGAPLAPPAGAGPREVAELARASVAALLESR
jgi:1-acyl-sn-glycerol-3-phosphate acyltransferase